MISNNKMSKYIQIILLAIVTLIISFSSIESMRANAWYFNSLNTVKHLPLSLNDNLALTNAQDAIKLAIELEPTQPHYWHFYAYITMRTLSASSNAPQVSNNIQKTFAQAEAALRTSLTLRQSWPETWIELAKVVSYQEGPSDDVFEYIAQAKKVGPYNLDVSLGVVQIALMNWSQLSPKYKGLYVKELGVAATHGYYFFEVFELAKKINKLPTLCLSLQFGSAFNKIKTSYSYKKHCK